MHDLNQAIQTVQARIRAAEARFQRPPGSVDLLAVSKTMPAGRVAAAADAGLRRFGENYLQEALDKIEALRGRDLEWHFIGPIQSNKTRKIAEQMHWVHSVERLKIAQRLSEQRPESLPPLNICLQVNISHEVNKSGLMPADLLEAALAVAALPRLRLRGLMAIPVEIDDFDTQRHPFAALRELFEGLRGRGLALDTLSMGMSGDLEAAIAEGATLVRVGSALFGPRPRKG